MKHSTQTPAFLLALMALGGGLRADDGRGERLRELRTTLARAEQGARREDPRAEDLFREALDAAGEFGESVLLARALDGLAGASRRAGRLDEAQALYARVIPLWEELLGPRQPRLAVSLHNLGNLHLERGETRQAEPLLRRALLIWVATLGADSAEARNTRRALDSLARTAE